MGEGQSKRESEPSIDPLLTSTIYDPEQKKERSARFEEVWQQDWHVKPGKGRYFETPPGASPFEDFSSKGWKIHLAIAKGSEKAVSHFLFENGLYFKCEGDAGTYFQGKKESGTTIYIGSRDNAQAIAKLIEGSLGEYLRDGPTVTIGDKQIHLGSGTDIELAHRVEGRFDVARTEYGWLSGNRKYSEHGLPSWTGLGGIPTLAKFDRQINHLLDYWQTYTAGERKLILHKAYGESRRELVKDFGQAFVLGSQDKTKFS